MLTPGRQMRMVGVSARHERVVESPICADNRSAFPDKGL